ncbi:MAG: iron ABC transporter permease [Treponemataceae bacterium]|nr:iron ABC transporter permease [Treponemataceae bacterium]
MNSSFLLVAALALCALVLTTGFFLVSAGSAFSAAHATSATSASGSSSATATQSVFSRRTMQVLLFTIKESLCSTAIALTVGFAAAFFAANRRFAGRRFLLSLSAVPLCIPPLLIALGFVRAYGMNGGINRILMQITGTKKTPLTFLYSFWGIIIAQGFYNFPIIMRTVTDSWERLPQTEHDAALLLGAGRLRVFRTITLVQLMPAIASSALIVFLYCFFSFIIILIFGSVGCTTLEVEIYQAARTTLDFSYAGRLALLETGTALIFALLYVSVSSKGLSSSGILMEENRQKRKKISGAAEIILFSVFAVLVLLFFLLPLVLLVVNAFSSMKNLFSRNGFSSALKNTCFTAFASAFLSTVTAFAFSYSNRRLDPAKKSSFFRIASFLPMTVSSVVLGFGITRLSGGLAKSPFLLVVAQSSLQWPFALQQISRQMDRIPQNVLDAADLLSPNPLNTLFSVVLPQCRRSILSAFAFCAAISAGDATLPLVLAIPRFETLALFTYRLSGAYRFDEACACGTVLMFLSVILFFAADTERTSAKKGK